MKKKSENARPKKYPITTVTQCRVPIFWPMSKPPRSESVDDLVIENKWGRAIIKRCKLTQVHRNLLDLIFAHHHGIYFDEDGSVWLLIDLYEIQKMFQIEETNHSWLVEKLDDLTEALFVTETKHWVITSGIIHKHAYSKTDADHPFNKFGDNKLYYVVFESEFMRFFKLDTNLYYEALLDKIIALKYGSSQALARFCLSHRQVNMKLESILTKIGVFRSEMTKQQRNNVRKQVLHEAEKLKNDFGIEIKPMKDKKRLGVFYSQHKKVWFENPKKMAKDFHAVN